MLYRTISKRIEEYLRNPGKRMLLIDGARQIGKSTVIRWVGQRVFEHYVEVNMEVDKMGDRVFADVRTVADFYLALSTVAGSQLGTKENTLVFIDEIQVYPHLLTMVKFLMADGRFTYIASGSQLGVTLSKTQSVPVGSLSVEHMFPMDFEEFLLANGVGQDVIVEMERRFNALQSLPKALHNKMMDYFRKYLLVGGLPDAVLAFTQQQNIQEVRRVHNDVHDMYVADAQKYENENNRRLKIRRIYSMIPSVLEHTKKRIVVKDIENKDWTRFVNYQDEFEYLIASGITLEVKAVSKPSFPLIENSGKNLLKLYMNDTGMLSWIYYGNNIKAIMETSSSINLGSVYETAVAQELRAHGHSLYYYDNKKVGEVDFLIDDIDNLCNLPIEVKSGKDYTVHSALNRFLSLPEYNIKRAFVLCNEEQITQKEGIIYLPIYNVMFLRKQ